MEFFKIDISDDKNIKKLSAFATEIVREHYDPIIGKETNDYMLEKFQSERAIKEQIEEGYTYYAATVDGQWVGFCGIEELDGKLYLSKFYLHKNFRKKGYSSIMMKKVAEECEKRGLGSIFLRVNKKNDDSIEVYEHFGFKKIRADKGDIGHGFFMDDFIMEKGIK